jgi:hypothetical protein
LGRVTRADPALRDALERACADAMMGDPVGVGLMRRLERACVEVLRRSGVNGARVVASADRGGVRVDVSLPGPAPAVEQIMVRVGRA